MSSTTSRPPCLSVLPYRVRLKCIEDGCPHPARSTRAHYCRECSSKAASARRRAQGRARRPGAPALSDTRNAVSLRQARKERRAQRAHGSDATYWRNIKSRYGITQDQYLQLLAAQDGRCAICGRPPRGRFRHLSVDHLHSKKFERQHGLAATVRGLLCWRDNYWLVRRGVTPEHLEAAARYLRRWPARSIIPGPPCS